MARILTNNPERGSGNWGKRVRVGLKRRVIPTLMKTDPQVSQGTREVPIAEVIAATLTTALAGADNDVKYTSKELGPGGNSVRIAYINPGGTVGRTIVVAGKDVTVNLAVTAGAINATETAASIVASINADAAASKVVSAAVKVGDSGLGVVIAMALTNLTGGVTNFTAQKQFGGFADPGISVGPHFEDKASAPGNPGPGVKRIRDRGKNLTLLKR